ncbi:hypothetical protein BT96DRAFT_726831 [Gymnopus androsaceus JB14]|uniref:Uncharacterized protein n=1 Tax=Gymnopus androsaceus JB14 TaxID=1447944 RepID=A0A6A4GE54_9AGAR|nr:hypothetical protein BT96DRAFT_726831 [Gymnopus androsaceus JB14]
MLDLCFFSYFLPMSIVATLFNFISSQWAEAGSESGKWRRRNWETATISLLHSVLVLSQIALPRRHIMTTINDA